MTKHFIIVFDLKKYFSVGISILKIRNINSFLIDVVFVFVQVYIFIERIKYVLGKTSNTRYQSAITLYVFPWTLVFTKLGKVSSYVYVNFQ